VIIRSQLYFPLPIYITVQHTVIKTVPYTVYISCLSDTLMSESTLFVLTHTKFISFHFTSLHFTSLHFTSVAYVYTVLFLTMKNCIPYATPSITSWKSCNTSHLITLRMNGEKNGKKDQILIGDDELLKWTWT
jgi:hypothetical protein